MRKHQPSTLRLTALAAALLALNVQAQTTEPQQPQQPQQLQRVEITGSNIKRINAETAVPVQVVTRAQIEASGVTTVKGLIDELSASTGGLSDIEGGNRFSPGASAISFRGLGEKATLVLLNGRRIAPYGLADYATLITNVDALPIDAIERVEVLKSGASAIYGSDAIAGVVNFITRRDFKGFVAGASYADSLNKPVFGEKNAYVLAGMGDIAQDRFNVFGMLSGYQRDPLFYSEIINDTPERLTQYSPSYGTPSTFSYPGNIIGQGALAGCTTKNAAGLCVYNRYERFQAIPDNKRLNFTGQFRFALDADTEVFVDAMASRTEVAYSGAFQTYGGANTGPIVWGNPGNNTSQTFRYRNLPATHPLNTLGRPAEFRYRFVDSGEGKSVEATEYRVVAGIKGIWNNYDWEVALNQMGSDVDSKDRGSFSNSGFKAMIGDYNNPGADFFNKTGGYKIGQVNSAEVLNTLFPTYGYKGSNKTTTLDAKMSGELMALPAGMMSFAAGLVLTKENIKIDPTANLRAGDIVGNGLSAADSSRNFSAVFGELSVPVLKSLEAQVAARLDKYPGFGAHFSPKLALRFQPAKEFLLRGTIENGFRAPNLTESADSTKFAFQNAPDPKRCAPARNLQRDLRAQAAPLPNSDPNKALLLARGDSAVSNECGSAALITRNNPDLKPETARTVSAGFVFEPVNEFSLALDYWNIERKDEIAARSGSRLLSEEGAGSPNVLRDPIALDPTFTAAERAQYGVTAGKLSAVLRQFVNLNKTKTDGFDLEARFRTDTPIGKLGVTLTGTYTQGYHLWNTTTNQWSANYAGGYTTPRLRSNVSFSLRTPQWTHALSFRNSTGYKIDYNADDDTCAENVGFGVDPKDCRVPGNTVTDYYIAYNGIKHLQLSMNFFNIFNKGAPTDVRAFAIDDSGIIPQNFQDAKRSSYRFNVKYTF